MKYWSYDEPLWDGMGAIYGHKVVTLSEEEIIKSYHPYWYKEMVRKYGKEHVQSHFTKQDCIDDWVVVNWAWQVCLL